MTRKIKNPVKRPRQNRSRDRTEIRVWMLRQKVRGNDIARLAGVTPAAVALFLAGRNDSPKARAALVKAGCPRRLLESGAEQSAA